MEIPQEKLSPIITADISYEILLLVSTNKGGFIYYSDEKRKNWEVNGPYLLGSIVHHMILDNRDSRTILMAAQTKQHGSCIFKSTDFGMNWIPTNFPTKLKNGKSINHIFRLASGHASEPNVWYAGTSPQGLFRSDDFGDTWHEIESLSKDINEERDILYNVAVIYHNRYKYGGKKDRKTKLHKLGKPEYLDKAIDYFKASIDEDKYFLKSYLNLIYIYQDPKNEKMVKKWDRRYKKSKYELTDIYKEYKLNGNMYKEVDFSFLDGSIFRIYLGTYDEYNLPEDIYLHSDLITLSHDAVLNSYIMGSFDDFKKATNYLNKLLRMQIYKDANIHIIAFKDGIRTDFE